MAISHHKLSYSPTFYRRHQLFTPATLLTSLPAPGLLVLFILSRHSGRRIVENSSSLCQTPDVEFAETDFHTLGVFGFGIGYHAGLVGYLDIDIALCSTLPRSRSLWQIATRLTPESYCTTSLLFSMRARELYSVPA
ncbi:hypothetical protein FRC12_018994 [Ceratobasidium sp. 428]|nr:hypothetical protein FRC12_018994 [Ceratobasidium sp. 428]